jgi:hypothetical protein
LRTELPQSRWQNGLPRMTEKFHFKDLQIHDANINQRNSDGNSDAQDLNDLRVILNYIYRWA